MFDDHIFTGLGVKLQWVWTGFAVDVGLNLMGGLVGTQYLLTIFLLDWV